MTDGRPGITEIPGGPAIRRAALRDLEAIVAIHREGFAGYRSSLLGVTFLNTIIGWFITSPEAAALVVFHDDRPAGFVYGAPTGYAGRLNRFVLPTAALSLLRRPWLLFHPEILKGIPAKARLLAGPRRSDHGAAPGRAVFSLVGIGVASAFRGLGLAGRLMTAFEEEARRMGFEKLRLSVKRNNQAAINAYLKAGWVREERESSSDLWVYVRDLAPRTGEAGMSFPQV